MNLSRLLPVLCLLLLTSWITSSRAQDADPTGADATAPAGSTVITSDVLHADQNTHISIFTGNVVVVGTNFHMTCDEMTVFFVDGKVSHIIATGNVVIIQPDRITHCGHAEYFKDEDKFILTDSPNILDNKNQIFAPEITIYRTDQKMITKGATKVILVNGGPGSSDTTTPAAPLPAQ